MSFKALLLCLGLSSSLLAQADPINDYNAGVDAFNRKDYATAFRNWQLAAGQGIVPAQFGLGLLFLEGEGVTQDSAMAAQWLLKAATKGDTQAQFNLGLLYAKGQGLAQDYAQAILWYRKAADQGMAAAQSNLASLYRDGSGAPQDYALAAQWFLKAAAQGDVIAQSNLGLFYAMGQGVTQDYTQALLWYRKAAEQGNAAAQSNLAGLYRDGSGVPQDYAAAAQWFQKAAAQGDVVAQFNLGQLYATGHGVAQDYTQAIRWLRQAADQGEPAAQSALANLYLSGAGAVQDNAMAAQWLLKVAARGDAQAQFNLGLLYATGSGVAQDYAQALQWYRKAADQGMAAAESNLAVFYLNGTGVARDYAQSLWWSQKAAAQGEAAAETNLGGMYASGLGVAQDPVQAAEWFRKAADQGNSEGQYQLGSAYALGLGVSQDDSQALAWFGKAAAQGDKKAQHDLVAMQARIRQKAAESVPPVSCSSAPQVSRIGPFQTYAGDCLVSYTVSAELMKQLKELGRKEETSQSPEYVDAQKRMSFLVDFVRAAFRDEFDHIIYIWDYPANPLASGLQGFNRVPNEPCPGTDCPRFLSSITLTYFGRQLADSTLLHEVFHQYGNHAISTGYLGHWGYSSAGGVLGGFDARSLKNLGQGKYQAGTLFEFDPRALSLQRDSYANQAFDVQGGATTYSPLELFMMGLGPASDVPDLLVAENPVAGDCKGNLCSTFSASGFRRYSAADIARLMGPYMPLAGKARHQYRGLVVVLTTRDHIPDEQARALSRNLDQFTRQAAPDFPVNDQGPPYVMYNFWSATQGRASYAVDHASSYAGTNASADLALYHDYDAGIGVTADKAQAIAWLQKAVGLGLAEAEDVLGNKYELGDGVAMDYAQALAWYRKAAEQGNAAGEDDYGRQYANGNGVARDLERAQAWFQKAADQGSANGKAHLQQLGSAALRQ